MQSWNAAFSFFVFLLAIRCGGGGGGGISGRVRALNWTVPLGSGRVGSDDLGYGPGSGFSFEPVQTSRQYYLFSLERKIGECLGKEFEIMQNTFHSQYIFSVPAAFVGWILDRPMWVNVRQTFLSRGSGDRQSLHLFPGCIKDSSAMASTVKP